MLDLSVVLAFVAYGVCVGWWNRRRASRSLSDYFLAGRGVRGWQAGTSMAATQFAADTPLLVMGMLAVSGAASLWRLWIYGLAFLMMGFLLGAAWQRAGVVTDAELTMLRYSSRGALALRVLKAFYYGTVVNCVVLAFVLVAAVRIFEIFLPWHLWLPEPVYAGLWDLVRASGIVLSSGITGLPAGVATTNNAISLLLVLVFVALYSTAGGLRAVIATDVVQFALMLLGTVAYAVVAVNHAGGTGGMLDALEGIYGSQASQFTSLMPAGDAVMGVLVVVSLQWFFQLNSDGTGYLAQRTMACSDEREARTAAVVFTFAQIVVRSLLWLVIGVALLVVYPFDAAAVPVDQLTAERELVFAYGIDELLPAGLRGVMLTGMLAALASTLDTHLNWGASYWSNDLYRGWWLEHVVRRAPRPRELVLVARIANGVLVLLALAVMTQLETLRSAWQVSLLFGAGMGAVLVLRWLWWRINLYSELLAIVSSLLLAPLLLAFVSQEWLRLALMAAVSTLVVVGAALWLPQTEARQLDAFYRRVRPPGWWGNAAVRAGEAPGMARRRLLRGSLAIGACAVSVYGALIGLEQIVFQRAGLETVACLGAAALAVPVWLRYVRQGADEPLRRRRNRPP